MLLNSILIISGFVLLMKGADFLVEGASKIAKKFHIPDIVIGLTIVAIGTSMPELVVSLTSALDGYSDLSIGNIVGSNIANLFLILGVCAIISPLIFKKETRLIEIPFTVFTTVLLFYLCINKLNFQTNIITRQEGVILLIFCVLFIIYNLIMARSGEKYDCKNKIIEIKINNDNELKLFDSILLIAVGILSLKLGGDLVVDNAVKIANVLGISEKLISLTIVAFSTSLPELVTSISATKKGETDMAIGNVLGSQIFNIILIIGITAILAPISYSTSYNSNIVLLIIGTILLGLFSYIGKKNQMTRSNGIIFVFIYIVYLIQIICFT